MLKGFTRGERLSVLGEVFQELAVLGLQQGFQLVCHLLCCPHFFCQFLEINAFRSFSGQLLVVNDRLVDQLVFAVALNVISSLELQLHQLLVI